jgi:succinate dehydrogenase / fumarate reductase, cytochrome b subunit
MQELKGRMRPRPVYLNLFQIRQPLPAVISILHRFAGVLLFLLLPAVIGLLALSLSSADAFATVAQALRSWPLRVLFLVPVWFFWHHFSAGIRYLILDMHIGLDRTPARRSSAVVIAAGLLLTLLTGVLL